MVFLTPHLNSFFLIFLDLRSSMYNTYDGRPQVFLFFFSRHFNCKTFRIDRVEPRGTEIQEVSLGICLMFTGIDERTGVSPDSTQV